VVIAPSFADIFANNSVKNGFLTVTLNDEQVSELLRRAGAQDGYQLTVDLESCEVRDQQGFRAKFSMDEFARHCLLEGLDEIGLTLQHETEIRAYEKSHTLPRSVENALQLTMSSNRLPHPG
jgi:3-isopropylmalate/(R)-2-methylmalate dehydratase small subunit